MPSETPSGWRAFQLADAATRSKDSFVYGPFGSNLKTSDYSDAGVQMIQLQNIGEGHFIGDNRKFVPQWKANELSRHKAMPGDVVIAKMADPVARACRVPNDSDEWIIVADCMRLRVDEARFDPDFMVATINGRLVRAQAEARATGSTRKRINLGKTKKLEFIAPDLHEQKKIAAILSSVDEAIQATQAVIEQTRRVKEGLLQDLLTRGIGHTRFKQTEIGEIPESWKVVPCSRLARQISVGIVVRPTQYYSVQGVPCWRSANIGPGFVRDADWVFIRPDANEVLSKSRLDAGDIVVVRTGYPGTACVVPDWLDQSNCVDVLFIRPEHDEVYTDYLCWFINSDIGKEQVLAGQGGLAQKHFNVKELKRMLIAVPPVAEQRKIVGYITEVLATEEAGQAKLNALQAVKAGLLQDLLTGKVRVSA